MANASSSAAEKALTLITAGLQSGAIKLHGVTSHSSATAFGKADAAYLKALIADLTEAIKAQE